MSNNNSSASSGFDLPLRSASAGSEPFLAEGGEMGALMRSHDWSHTPLGPPESWPQSLRSAVSILLPSRAQICLFWGPDLVALYNDAYRPALGLKHPWALGRPAREVWREFWEDVLRPLLEHVRTTGAAFWASDHPFFLERHGYPEETYFDISYDPVRDETGGVGGVFCIVSETTGRVLGERRLRTLRDVMRVAGEAQGTHEAFLQVANVLAENPNDLPFANLYEWSSPASKPQHVAGYGTGKVAPELWSLERAAAEGEVVLTGENLAGLGPIVAGPWPEPVREVVTLPITGAGQTTYGFIVAGVSPRRALDDSYRDFLRLVASNTGAAVGRARALAEERTRAEALAELDRAKTLFFSNVSHEFRTPLTLMLGPTEDALISPQRALSGSELEMVHRNEVRLLKLVNTLLDFSRLEAGRVQAFFQPVDLAAVTADLASLFRSAVEKAGLHFEVRCDPLPQSVYVDQEMWEKVLFNLLSNALKSTFEGVISVSIRAAGDSAQLVVSDTGTGISQEHLPRLFERFHRIEGARRRTHEGSGIGLALVQGLVKIHGGTIEVRSQIGRGTTFVVSIPFGSGHLPQERIACASAEQRPATAGVPYVTEALSWLGGDPGGAELSQSPHELTEASAPSSRGAARVLVVDDNPDMREYVRRLLVGHYEVVTAANGRVALESARQSPPDLVLTDVMMPEMDGFEFLAALRGDHSTSTIPVILLSARAGDEARIEGMQHGADDYLTKPFSARELLARVKTHLELARIRTRLAVQNSQLLQSLRTHSARSELLAQTLRDLLGARDPDAIIRNLFSKVAEHLGVDTFFHYMISDSGDHLELHASAGIPDHTAQNIGRLRLNEAICGTVAFLRQPIVAQDIQHSDYDKAALVRSLGIQAYACHPLLIGDRLLGTFSVATRTRAEFQPDEIEFLRLVTQYAAVAIDRLKGEQALRDSEQRLRETNIELRAEIAERTLAQASLLQRSAQYETLLRHVPVGVFLVDSAFRIRDVNPVAYPAFGNIPDLVGRDFGEVVRLVWPTDYAEEVIRLFRNTLETGQPFEVAERGEYRVDRGTLEYYTWRITRIPLPEGDYGVVCYFRDISSEVAARAAIREQEERLRKVEKIAAAGKLAASLAHEINNPLSSVTNALYLLETRTDLDSSARYLLTLAATELSRVSRIVQQSLSYHRTGAQPRDVDLTGVVSESIQVFQDKFRRLGVEIVAKTRPGSLVFGVDDEIRQVVDNLLLNAAEAAAEKGRVIISVRPGCDWRHGRKGVRLTVADTGLGIPKDNLARIFEPFFTTKAEKGTGLGLWVLRGIVSKHEGSVHVRSSSAPDNSGTVFSVFLPSHARSLEKSGAAA